MLNAGRYFWVQHFVQSDTLKMKVLWLVSSTTPWYSCTGQYVHSGSVLTAELSLCITLASQTELPLPAGATFVCTSFRQEKQIGCDVQGTCNSSRPPGYLLLQERPVLHTIKRCKSAPPASNAGQQALIWYWHVQLCARKCWLVLRNACLTQHG